MAVLTLYQSQAQLAAGSWKSQARERGENGERAQPQSERLTDALPHGPWIDSVGPGHK